MTKTREELLEMKQTELLGMLSDDTIKANNLKKNSAKTAIVDTILKTSDNSPVQNNEKGQGEEQLSLDSFKELIKEVKEEEPLKTKLKDKVYVAVNHNFNLKAKGYDKEGRLIRYVEGLDTLDLKEQNEIMPNGVPVKLIRFAGNNNEEANIFVDGFGVTRSTLRVPKENQLLQQYLERLKVYGREYILYDKTETRKRAIIERDKTAKLESLVANAGKDALLKPLLYMEVLQGNDAWQRFFKKDLIELKELAYDAIDYNQEEFINAVESSRATLVHLAHKLASKNIIEVSSDGYDVKWVENGKTIVEVPAGSIWSLAFVNFLLSAENQKLLVKLQQIAGVRAI